MTELELPPLPEESAVRVWAKGGKFTRGLYESPADMARELWAIDGDTEEPLFTADQLRSYAAAAVAAERERMLDAVTPEMVSAGLEALAWQKECSSDHLVTLIFQGMLAAAIRSQKETG